MSGRILIVEDNPTTRKMLRLTLETEGYSTTEAGDARAALAAVDTGMPDLILQDLILPDMDGLDLLRELRLRPGGGDVPILALSGFLGRLEESQTAEARFTARLVKPIEPDQLLEAIRVYLPGQQPAEIVASESCRLLIVDDDPVQLKLARLHFSQRGFSIVTATGAADAMVAMRTRVPDAILSDVFMPDVDGFQLCLDVRHDPALAHIPVVLMSSQYGAASEQDLARQVGAHSLVLRTPDLDLARLAIVEALGSLPSPPVVDNAPSDQLKWHHAQLVIEQFERQSRIQTGLAQRCALQAAQLSLLSGVADALTHNTDPDIALRDVLGATLDAAGISKGALIMRDNGGSLQVRQAIGFSEIERDALGGFFGHFALLEQLIERGSSVAVPSGVIPEPIAQVLLARGGVATMQVVPLIAGGHAVGAMIIGATRTDVTSEDSVAFARAMGNQIVQSLTLARSIGARRQIEAALREERDRARQAEERMRFAMESAAVGVWDMDYRTNTLQWSDILESQHGLPPGSFRGTFDAFVECIHPEDRAAALETISAATRSGQDFSINYRSRWPNGTVRWLTGAGRVLRGPDGQPTRGVGIGLDVTERRTLEEQYQQAQKMEAIGRLAGGVAHDFNNLLTAILGYCELLLQGMGATDPRQADIAEIQKAGVRASGLTRQLLAFSRKEIVQPTILDVNAIVTDLRSMLERLIGEDIKVTIGLGPGVAKIHADRGQVEQVILNLAVNARDAMPKGGVLRIETATVELDENYKTSHFGSQPGPYVVLAVTDTGMGMTPETQARLFEPFFTTKGPGKGTGLGLATVHGIVSGCGGNVNVYSELSKGTSFKVYFPAVVAPDAFVETARPTTTSSTGGSESVLLVEDSDSLRDLTKRLLQRQGYKAIVAANAEDALELFEQNALVDVLLTDVVMPGASGADLATMLKERRPDLKVIYMSGYTEDAIVHHGVLKPGIAFLHKPFTAQTLGRKMREVLDRK